MKAFITILFVLFSFVVNADPLKVVYHLNEGEKASILIASLNELIKTNDELDVKVVVHGSAVIRLSSRDTLSSKLEELLNKGVKIGVCSISMLKQGIKHSLIMEGVELIKEGGVQRILNLQKQGYLYIKI